MRLCKIHLYTKYQMSISIGSKFIAKTLYLTFDLQEWPWPLMLPLKMCSLVIVTCTPNIKCLSLLDQMLWPMWPIYLTFDFKGRRWPWHITSQIVWLHKIHILTKYQVSICICSKVMGNVKVVWPKLYIWPLTLKNDLDLILSPLKMCSSWDEPVH